MTSFEDEDWTGAALARVNLTDSSWARVRLNNAKMTRIDLSGVEVRGAAMYGGRLIGMEFSGVEMTGEFDNVTINGVEIGPLVEAELDRRMPDRVKMRPDTVEGFREAWEILSRLWADTIDRARRLPPERLHESVGGEWSFVETLRHLDFAMAAWIDRMVLGDPSPWHPLDLPWDQAPGWPGIPWDRDARPSLDDVLAVRADRIVNFESVLADLTAEQLASTVSCTEPGWPDYQDFSFRDCLWIVVNEHWEHRLYAERDLDALG